MGCDFFKSVLAKDSKKKIGVDDDIWKLLNNIQNEQY